jgi:hypothetical protein
MTRIRKLTLNILRKREPNHFRANRLMLFLEFGIGTADSLKQPLENILRSKGAVRW